MSFLFINIILLLAIVFLFVILSMVWPPDSPWAPWWRTKKEVARSACRLAKINSKDLVYELGCGDGTFLITAVKEFGAKGVGIEIDPLRALLSTLLSYGNKVNDRVKIKRKNFFDENLSKASVIFVYLVPKTLQKLKQKLLKELRSGTRVISYRYEMDLPLIAFNKKSQIRLYKIP